MRKGKTQEALGSKISQKTDFLHGTWMTLSPLSFLVPYLGIRRWPTFDVTTYEWWWWWFTHSVMSDSLQPHGQHPAKLLSMGILQASILEWVAISFSRRSSQPRNQTLVLCIAGRFFTIWAIREAQGLKGHGRMNWEIGTDINTLLILWENLLDSTGNSTWCSVVT